MIVFEILAHLASIVGRGSKGFLRGEKGQGNVISKCRDWCLTYLSES
ncbi:MAG TPA: hypothetical protein VN207_01040 [Ktedonobacteraceae bacterium]|nr:hypothetical protein [Ktedonobacteraceae bacterium]